MALTTRQRLKEHSSSSPRKAVRPLVVKQTEYPERENCQVWEVIQSLYPFLLCHLSAQFSRFFHTKCGWFFTFQSDPARSSSCLFALAEKSQHTEVNQIAKARHSVTALPQATNATSGHWCRGFKVIWTERPPWNWLLLLKWEGRDNYLCYSKSPNDQSINWCQKIELYLNCTALLENSQLS